jgi:hypothetical protein
LNETVNDELAGIAKAIEFFCCPARSEMSPEMVMSIADSVYRTLNGGPRSSFGLGYYNAAQFIANARTITEEPQS